MRGNWHAVLLIECFETYSNQILAVENKLPIKSLYCISLYNHKSSLEVGLALSQGRYLTRVFKVSKNTKMKLVNDAVESLYDYMIY